MAATVPQKPPANVKLSATSLPASGWPIVPVSRTATNTVVVSWPLPDTGWRLQATINLSATPIVWTEIEPPYQTSAMDLYYVEPVPTGQKYYRLHKQYNIHLRLLHHPSKPRMVFLSLPVLLHVISHLMQVHFLLLS